ncbi:hypothetical protein AV530_002193 [Patagioenas fasciata monilis]|uniref:Uncharacterized protein n=1 Tax=Patagioenas fasciata monilis TaxID=372326 RepID=A0A1V4K5R2_PATFA|nr:hypothetical protein AV530_002193 [Patagioenas fasciata monilis]
MKLEVEMAEFVFRGAADAQRCAGEQVLRGCGTRELEKLMENSMGSVWYAGTQVDVFTQFPIHLGNYSVCGNAK